VLLYFDPYDPCMRFLLLSFAIFAVFPSFAHATADETYEEEMAHKQQAQAPSGDDVLPGLHQLSFDGPIALSKSTNFPYGFQQKDIAPPFRLGIKLEPTLTRRNTVGVWFNANLGFLQTNIAPIIDAAFGFKFKLDNKWYLLFGLQFTDQELPQNGAINQSQFDTTYFGLIGGFGYHDPHWDARLNLKSVFYHDTPIASDEGIETDVAHDATFIEGITVTYTTSFGLKGLASVDEYSFGKTGIVSKEFALGFDAHSETRFRLGASYEIAPFEIRAESRFTAGVGDQIENSYCAIFLNDDYVLSPVVLYLGVAWNF
jgi:hypothetical protein